MLKDLSELYWYKSTNTDDAKTAGAGGDCGEDAFRKGPLRAHRRVTGALFTCFTGTKVQILRSKKDLSERIGESQVLSLLALLVQRYKY